MTLLDLVHAAVWIGAVLAIALGFGALWAVCDRLCSRYLSHVLDDPGPTTTRRDQLDAAAGRKAQ